MDQQDLTASNSDSVWPEMSVNSAAARGTARSITLDTQRASADGRILEITAQLEEMRNRLASFETDIFDAHAPASNTDELLPRFAAIDEEIGSTKARFEELATRVALAEEHITTSMFVSAEGLDSRLAIVEDARLVQTDELNQLTSYLEQAFTRIAELAEVIEEERLRHTAIAAASDAPSAEAVEAMQAQIDEVENFVIGLQRQLEHSAEAINSSTGQIHEALSASVAEIDSRLSETESRVGELDNVSASIEFLTARADALDAQQQEATNEANSHRSEIIEHVDSAHSRIDETQLELLELKTRIVQPASPSPDLVDDLDGLRQSIVETNDSHQNALALQREDRHEIEAHRRAIERVEADAKTARELVHDVSDRIANMSETAELIGQRVDLVQNTTDDLQNRVESIRAATKSTDEHVEHVEHVIHAVEGRLDNAAVALDAAHARIDGVDGTVQSVQARVDQTTQELNTRVDQTTQELNTRVDASDARWSDNDDRMNSLEQRTAQAEGRTTDLSTKLDQTIDCVEGAVGATADISERVSGVEQHLTLQSEHLAATEQQLHERVSAASDTASHALAIGEGLEQSVHADIDQRTEALRAHMQGRIEEARAQLQQALDRSQTSAKQAQSQLEQSVANRLNTVQEAVESRIAQVEDQAIPEPRIESLESSLHAIQHGADEAMEVAKQAAGTATEAYAFSESLRQLQTDVVQAIQQELRLHNSQLGTLGDRVHHVEASGSNFASADRLHMLEAKLVEALQTLSQLTQLQRRNTTVEAQLTDTLTATSHGVESTQASVAQLREQLDAAQQRITHLEQLLSANHGALGAVKPLVATRQAAPNVPSEIGDRDAVVHLNEGADTGWFTESYARKSQEPKAS